MTTLKRDAIENGAVELSGNYERLSTEAKHNIDRIVNKRRRRKGKKIVEEEVVDYSNELMLNDECHWDDEDDF